MSGRNEIITFSENNIAQIEKLEEFLETMEYPLVSSEEFTNAYLKLVEHKKETEALQKAIDSKLKELLGAEYEKTGNQTVESGECKITYVPGSMRETFNSTKFKAEHPDLYEQYLEVSVTSPSLRTTKKK